jgi:hypothetical protein
VAGDQAWQISISDATKAYKRDAGHLPVSAAGSEMEFAVMRSRRIRFCLFAAILTISAGLCLRRYGYDFGFSFLIVKYGGSILWGSMVYFIVAAILFRFPDRFSIALALATAVLVEFFRLYHTSWLDAFRMTTVGALLIGRIFSAWNIAAYFCGILIAFLVARAVCHDVILVGRKDVLIEDVSDGIVKQLE